MTIREHAFFAGMLALGWAGVSLGFGGILTLGNYQNCHPRPDKSVLQQSRDMAVTGVGVFLFQDVNGYGAEFFCKAER